MTDEWDARADDLGFCCTCIYGPHSDIHAGHCRKDFHNTVATALRQAAAKGPSAGTIYEAIKHGDANHRRWLRDALNAVWAGEPVPLPYPPVTEDEPTSCRQAAAEGREQGVAVGQPLGYARGQIRMRNQAAECMADFPPTVLQIYSRGPDSPPGNQFITSTNEHRAQAIRALPVTEDEPTS